MRQQTKILKNHPHFAPSKLDQLFFIQFRDVLAIDRYLAAGNLVEARKAANQCRFSRTRKTHDNKHFAASDIDQNIPDARNVTRLSDVLETHPRRHLPQKTFRLRPEKFPDIAAFDDCFAYRHFVFRVSGRPGSPGRPPYIAAILPTEMPTSRPQSRTSRRFHCFQAIPRPLPQAPSRQYRRVWPFRQFARL